MCNEQTQPGTHSRSSGEESALPSFPVAVGHEGTTMPPSCTFSGLSPADDRATIGKNLQIKGEVMGSESLYIDGKVEGAIMLPDSRVTVGRDAQVSANITAREVVIFGRVSGNITASDRVDLRSEGSVTGDVAAQRITIGDGAFFEGGIHIGKPGRQRSRDVRAEISGSERLKTAVAAPT